jgi:hypothetical protein
VIAPLPDAPARRPIVLTWHVHGSYLASLAHAPATFVVPTKPGRPEGYGGRAGTHAWPDQLVEVPAEAVRDLELDVVLCQSVRNWEIDRHELCTPAQLALPQVFLEHNAPAPSPTASRHPVDDSTALVVHCTAFNQLMWDNGDVPTTVIDHGIADPGIEATYELERGLVVANDLARRGRILGADLVARVRAELPVDVVGMGSERVGGLGEVPPAELAAFAARYRFVFHPARWTSLGLAALEAMRLGLPVVGIASTELTTVIDDGRNGFVHTDLRRLMDAMRALLADRELARRIGTAGRATVAERFSMARFTRDWGQLLHGLARRDGCLAAPVAG